MRRGILLSGQVRWELKFALGFNDMEVINVTLKLLPWSHMQQPDCSLWVVGSERVVRKCKQ